ncbi:class I mannose-6-phosphate isomerase [Kineosporia sp. R_H_3]|uniref:class I mannose-6-phosphate isomerase n=1 Tax=Kineosporia sp. R_H_3 TaxID=1961848 RepID=UPI000B4B3FFD|nr:class I mannose-6-phosphate isomerase [Kineosporia sp. R_H_3]
MRPAPLLLPPNQFDHFYRGGDRIGALRGGPGGPQRPEEWVGSATTRFGETEQGLSRLPDGSFLRERVLADPVAWLGQDHVRRYGGDNVEILVKLLDPGQRLPVHVHPQRAFAREHLGLAHGKTEAWVVVEADPGAVVGLGFRRAVSPEEVAGLVSAHDSAALVDLCVTRSVRAGDGVLVPSGTPHFIGEGVLIVEVQEPTDLSILLEWDGFAVDGDRDGHLGLGFDLALRALDLTPWTSADLERHLVPAESLVDAAGRAVSPLAAALPADAEPYFRAHHVDATGSPDGDAGCVDVPAGLAVLLVLDGAGRVDTTDGGGLAVERGDAVLVPWCAGDWTLTASAAGSVRGVLCRPPAPDAPEAPR